MKTKIPVCNVGVQYCFKNTGPNCKVERCPAETTEFSSLCASGVQTTESEEAQPLSFSFSFAFAFCSAFSFPFPFFFLLH